MNQLSAPAPDLDRLRADLDALAEFRDKTAPGWTRRAFSEAGVAGRNWIRQRMTDARLDVRTDAVGNIIGTLPGETPALVTGSHTDTVHGGGRFDGIVGVLAGIEVARRFVETGIRPRHELRVVDFFGEEPNPYGLSCVGSRAVAGELAEEHLELRAPDGETLYEGLARIGADPEGATKCAWSPGEVHTYVELHIEQGPRLENSGTSIGVVIAIAGIHRALIELIGRADHAGTTPMDMRHDALAAAAETVLAVENLAEGQGVATAGRLESRPGAANVVPEHAELLAEFRSPDGEWLRSRHPLLESAVQEAARRRGVEPAVSWVSEVAPVPVPGRMQEAIAAAAAKLGFPHERLFSGAGHDAAHFARLAPMGMIFVPSRAGRSHCPEEFTTIDHIASGAHVLAQSLLELA